MAKCQAVSAQQIAQSQIVLVRQEKSRQEQQRMQ